jgi:outer membrane protein assembly factor BamB
VVGLGLAFGGPRPIVRSVELNTVPILIHSMAAWGVPVADPSAVYSLTRDHRLVSVDLASGRLRWDSRLGAGREVTAGSVVVLTDAMVIAGDFELFGFDRHTGVRRWQFSPAVGYGVGLYVGGIADGVVFTGSPSGRLYAIDAADGRLRWTTTALGEKVTVFSPVPVARGVVAGYTDFGVANRAGGVALFDSSDGRLKWRTSFASSAPSASFAGGPVMVDDLIVAASGDGTIHALDQRSGAVRWTAAPEAPVGEDYRPMTLSGRILVVGSLSGALTAVDVDSHHQRWRRTMAEEGSVMFGIVSDRQAVYAPYASGRVVALAVADGHELWRAGSPAIRFEWPPALGTDRIFLTSENGLYVLPKNGQ